MKIKRKAIEKSRQDWDATIRRVMNLKGIGLYRVNVGEVRL